jgi:dUTP pyrophosphatase
VTTKEAIRTLKGMWETAQRDLINFNDAEFIPTVIRQSQALEIAIDVLEAMDKPILCKLDPGAYVPTRAHTDDGGLDIYAPQQIVMFPQTTAAIDVGVHVAIPKGYVGKMETRSSMLNSGLTVVGGVIDSGYTGSIKVVLENKLGHDVVISKGDRIAQLLIIPCLLGEVKLVPELPETERGNGGFGSTGR